jgi:hypothetical protein
MAHMKEFGDMQELANIHVDVQFVRITAPAA